MFQCPRHVQRMIVLRRVLKIPHGTMIGINYGERYVVDICTTFTKIAIASYGADVLILRARHFKALMPFKLQPIVMMMATYLIKNQNDYLLKEFNTLLTPNTKYILGMELFSDGLTTFSLYNAEASLLETQSIKHVNACEEHYNEGTVSALYFGGTCTAPVEVDVTYA